MKNNRKHIFLFSLSFLLIFFSLVFNSEIISRFVEEKEIQTFSNEIFRQKESLIKTVNTFNHLLENKDHENELILFGNKLKQIHQNHSSIYVFKNDLPIYWTNNFVSLNYFKILKLNEPYVARLNNGWYLVYVTENKNKNIFIAGFTLIKREYVHQNQFLQNKISPVFSLKGRFDIFLEETPESKVIKINDTTPLFFIKKNANKSTSFTEDLLGIVCLLGIFIFLIFLFNYFQYWYSNTSKSYVLWFYYCLLTALWFFLFLSEFPYQYFNSILFSPSLYAESAIKQSLGHLTVNTMFLFFATFMFYASFAKKKNSAEKILSGILFYLLPLIGIFISSTIIGLIENSSINWGLNDLFGLNFFSYISFLVIGILFLIYFLIAEKVIMCFLYHKKNTVLHTALLTFSYLATSFVYVKLYHASDFFLTFWSVPIILVFILNQKSGKINYSFFSILLYIFLFSLIGAYLIEKTSAEKEEKKEKITAIRIGEDKDPVAEYLFLELSNQLISDPYLVDSGEWKLLNKSVLDEYLQKKYFTGYWSKFDVRFTYCRPNDSLIISPLNFTANCIDYIEKRQYKEDFNQTNQLLYINAPEGGISYIAKIKVYDVLAAEKGALNIYIELFSKIFPKTEGYPELLLDEKEIKQIIVPDEFSFAKYKQGTLMNAAGEYKYPLSSHVLPIDSSTTYFTENGFYHHVYKNENTVVVLGKKEKTILNHITAFSYLFVFYGFSLFLCLIIFFRQSFTINFYSFSNKLQLFLVSFILFSITLFGLGTSYYISAQYKQKNYKSISEKLRSVITELEGKIAQYETLDNELRDYLTFYLIKFSNVFYSDINLYNTKGELMATSRQEIFNIGLQGTLMNSEAYNQLSILKKSEFIQEEQIGNLHYLSGYIPFYNNKGQLLAYLNLPYFAKQNELEKEISAFLVAIINVYVLLFVLSVVIAFLFSAYLTKPLRLLREKIAGVQLGKANELLEWEGEDEIGSLVKEYNRMVIELENSAEKLAQSERESAWREMAKQVAHEIKNPLTPMKLSIQHLKRAFDDGAPDLNKRVEKTTQILIEQIETLSHIASEFSNFAKMPVSDNKNIFPEPILKNVVQLYSETENIEISYTPSEESKNVQIVADQDQLNRVFNNLIKNAIQSIPSEKRGFIEVAAFIKNHSFIVEFSDNGTGIPNNLMDKIFIPNFTTKTGGAGLGLAMVKNIVVNSNGNIWFETEFGKGTSFFVSWPIVK
ncbi:MAG: GHKL domain-containing protein [Flavobacteriales bacterium]|nr:GHKL domain-containing protein [Flavobacteriales bacterium]